MRWTTGQSLAEASRYRNGTSRHVMDTGCRGDQGTKDRSSGHVQQDKRGKKRARYTCRGKGREGREGRHDDGGRLGEPTLIKPDRGEEETVWTV